MKIITLEQIKKVINIKRVVQEQEQGFVAYSKNQAVVPPVGHMPFIDPATHERSGDYHIKYGMIKGEDLFVIKMAGAFYQNPAKHKIPAIQGLIMVLSSKTGEPLYLLQDEGYLTNVRTAVAGLICAKYLSPKNIKAIGVIGTGLQAELQIKFLKEHTDCRALWVWGRDADKAQLYAKKLSTQGFDTSIASSTKQLASECNLIVTTTSSTEPLLSADDILPGTHITALGADSIGKQELEPSLFEKADIVVVDSASQCFDHGEIKSAYEGKLIQPKEVFELGRIVSEPNLVKRSEKSISIADLTGVATQDIQIAKTVIGSIY